MNIKYHAAVGLIGEAIVPSYGMFFLMSIAPDVPLIANEFRLRKYGLAFDAQAVPEHTMRAYHATHCLAVTVALTFISHSLAVAHLLHIVSDWFTHTGRFAARPLFPISSWSIPFGKDVLK